MRFKTRKRRQVAFHCDKSTYIGYTSLSLRISPLISLFIVLLSSHIQLSSAEADIIGVCDRLQISRDCSCIDGLVSCRDASSSEDFWSNDLTKSVVLRGFNCPHCGFEGVVDIRVNAVGLNLERNRISDITTGSSSTQSLDVSQNNFRSLAFFDKFPSLRRANVSHNHLTTVSRIRLTNLNSLDLSTNRISEISSDAFRELSQLTILTLNRNKLSHLRHEWFNSLIKLQELSVSHNHLTDLPNLLFAPLVLLRTLDLSHNQITTVGMLSLQKLVNLEELNLSNNHITRLDESFAKFLRSVNTIDISNNPLSSLKIFNEIPTTNLSLIAQNMSNLTSINANDTIGLECLNDLDLSGSSSLQHIDKRAFERLRSLRILNLSHCGLYTLPRGILLPLVSLRTLSLDGNPWHCDCSMHWILYIFLNRQDIVLQRPELTYCASRPETINGDGRVVFAEASRTSRKSLLMDFLDKGITCQNATVANFTKKPHFRLGSTAVLYCDPQGIPEPSLIWRSKKFGAVEQCTNKCYESHINKTKARAVCYGCRVARYTCEKVMESCTENDCQQSLEECQRNVDRETEDGLCCGQNNLKRALDTCLAKQGRSRQELCLEQVSQVALEANSGEIRKSIAVCLDAKQDCLSTCSDNCTILCEEPVVSCVLDSILSRIKVTDGSDTELDCQPRMCSVNNYLFISKVSRGDSGYYSCRVENSLQIQTVTMHLTLDYDFLIDVKIYSLITGLAVAILFTVITLIGIGVEKILQHFGLSCPCDADGPIRRQNIVTILEQIDEYKKANLERLRENYNWQVQRIKENCILQMDRVKDSYIAEQTGKIRDYGSSQIGAIKDNYLSQVQRVRDYGNSQMDWLRENYVFQRSRIHKFSKHQLIRLRENYKLQQKHLNKILENLPNLESCRKGFYSETDLSELNLVPMLVPPPPPPESVLDFPNFDEFSLPDLNAALDSRSGTIITPEGSVISYNSGYPERPRKTYQTIEEVIRARLLPVLGPDQRDQRAYLRAVPEVDRLRGEDKKGHRRSYSAPITHLNLSQLAAAPQQTNESKLPPVPAGASPEGNTPPESESSSSQSPPQTNQGATSGDGAKTSSSSTGDSLSTLRVSESLCTPPELRNEISQSRCSELPQTPPTQAVTPDISQDHQMIILSPTTPNQPTDFRPPAPRQTDL